ncbi:MAG: MBL fold metallo-hydrolase, partial [Lentisphaeria bacterium]
MEIKVIGSGSSGNCYRISDGTTALLLEAGLPIKKIKQGCDFDLSGISGCLVTHEHGDHAKSVRDVMKSGVDVYMTRGTAEAANLDGYRLHRIVPMVSFKIGSLKVLPFEVHHDAAEPVGYLVDSQVTGERLLFMTDTYYTQFKFQSLTHIMIEANYSADEISDDPRAHRLRRSHMSIENCIELLKANDLSRCSEIWLIHLSSSNGDAEGFKRRVQEAT